MNCRGSADAEGDTPKINSNRHADRKSLFIVNSRVENQVVIYLLRRREERGEIEGEAKEVIFGMSTTLCVTSSLTIYTESKKSSNKSFSNRHRRSPTRVSRDQLMFNTINTLRKSTGSFVKKKHSHNNLLSCPSVLSAWSRRRRLGPIPRRATNERGQKM